MKKELLVSEIKAQEIRSAWSRGVTQYALELLDNLENIDEEDLRSLSLVRKALFNGADNWHQYSWGGSSLIYDRDIAERLCTPSELKKTHNGERRPNATEEWLDVQTRALYQAACRVLDVVRKVYA